MDIAGEMNGALAVYGIPAGGISGTEILDLQPDADVGAFNTQARNLGGRFPGCPTRGATQHTYPADLPLRYFGFKLGGSETFTIFAQTNLPG